ncbi:MAG: glutamine--fructose-6-phosphate transaminase (isomerizing) [Nitrospirae bacterium]|jgi:glucosamine--fructose-6-phosphate aminotransferase (isomerizing)|nr:glutamine--fructose-6-phosphate transaminase (isomerizing) [Nitrospirota bacterium]
MCGIIGYAGLSPALPYLLKGLEQLEYRGYDSAGVAVMDGGGARVVKSVGSTSRLKEKVSGQTFTGGLGIGHTRWATHGGVSEENAHPQSAGPLYIVHNGIVENERVLREELQSRGAVFFSETDTETIVHLVHRAMEEGKSFPESVRSVLPLLEGAYSFLMAHADPAEPLVAVHRGAPLLLGSCSHGVFVASDMTAFPGEVHSMIPLEVDDMVLIRCDGRFEILSLDDRRERKPEPIRRNPYAVHGKGEFSHYMFKEICEQPAMLDRILASRIRREEERLSVCFSPDAEKVLSGVRRIRIVGCGTSYHAGLFGKYRIESLAGIPVEVDIASEFRYRDPVLDPASDLLVALTQSGETADTLAALRMARDAGVPTLALVNAEGSTAAREADATILLDAGPEFGVAATKTFLSQIALLTLIGLYLASDDRLREREGKSREEILSDFLKIPALLDKALSLSAGVIDIARSLGEVSTVLFMGRGGDFPLALEGALKLKEISYIHAEGYAGGELKHGPLALVEKGTPVISLLSPDEKLILKMVSNMKETLSRGAFLISIGSERHQEEFSSVSSMSLALPDCPPLFFPLVSAVPLQLMAYHTACFRGLDVDRPRNLAKSVTVE